MNNPALFASRELGVPVLSGGLARSIAPRKQSRVLPTLTRPNLFGD